jgi:GNAT superfamily N-acetyltransferase
MAVPVRSATTADVEVLASTIAEAFQDDPVMSWCYPDEVERAGILPEGFRVILDVAVPLGGVETVDEVAGSIWFPPGAEFDAERMTADLLVVSRTYEERALTLLGLMEEHHPEDEHHYLMVLGTRTAWQSKGLGSALLRSVLTECDRDGMPAYLEATSELNRSLYERHGFEVTEVVHLPDGPPFWCMWREPG